MTKEERELQQNIQRVALNLMVLLDIGLFPGKHALGLEECKGLLTSLINDTKAKLEAMTPPAAPASSAPPPTSPVA